MVTKVKGPAGMLHVDDGGAGGLPVVFVPSATGNTTHWSAQLQHLRQTRRAIALDLRGRGFSEPPQDKNYSLESQATDIHAVVTKFGIHKFVLVGHSMGGSVAIAYAGRHPNRLAGLLLVDTAGDPRQIPPEQVARILTALESNAYLPVMKEYMGTLLTGSDANIQDMILRELDNADKEMNICIVRELFKYDPLPALAGYNGPMLSVVTPGNDNQYSLHKLLPDLLHVVIPGTGHWIHMDKPEEFNTLLDTFLNIVDAEIAGTARSTGT